VGHKVATICKGSAGRMILPGGPDPADPRTVGCRPLV